MVSKYRPAAPIVAVTSHEKVMKQLLLVWGVYPQLGKRSESIDEMLEKSVSESLKSGIVKHGDNVVITAGVPVGEAGTTNMMKIHVVGSVLAKGQGIGRKNAFGKVVIAKNSKEVLEKVSEHSVLVTFSTDRDMMPALEKCQALITEEGGLTSHAAVVGLNLGIPVIVGVKDALSILKDGQVVTVDANTGLVYEGHNSVL
jgi:pyruvate kinase